MKKQDGFTMIELLTVVAIIGILAVLAISNFSAFKGNALNATAASDARSMVPAADLASTNESTTLPISVVLSGAGGTADLGILATKYGGRYTPNTLGTIEVDSNHYTINTYQIAGDVCYSVVDGVMTATGGACS